MLLDQQFFLTYLVSGPDQLLTIHHPPLSPPINISRHGDVAYPNVRRPQRTRRLQAGFNLGLEQVIWVR
jgi:hypothetical protein